MSVEIIIAFVVGLVVGLFAAWLFWRQRISEHDVQARLLQASINEKEQGLKVVKTHLEQQEAKVDRLEAQVSQKDETIRDLIARLDWRKLTIGQLGEVVTEREERLSQSEETVRDLTGQIRKRNEAIHGLQKTISESETPAPVIEPDDLKCIEGIGPKISGLLNDAGILTFAQLAAAEVDHLEQILEKAGARYQLADPSTWPEQARLAAADDWLALASFQDELKGGRREHPQPF
jgi:predicted flap endonuclease-1-like 5' DNA nuclease